MARRTWTEDEVVAGVRAGDRRALARAISLVENRDPGAARVSESCTRRPGAPPRSASRDRRVSASRRSSGALVRHVRERETTVGVVSVDPSSPFSRGALLGDRIRLSDHFLDPGVFIRSMGTRGHLGGLAEATLQALLLLDAFGKDVVFVETVGTGQSEVEVIGIADVVLLVLMPGSGDSVQALKAGIMEIPDVIAINKKDQPGATTMLNDVRGVVALDPDPERRPPILLTEALGGEGVAELWEALEARRARPRRLRSARRAPCRQPEERGARRRLRARARAPRGRSCRRRAARAAPRRGGQARARPAWPWSTSCWSSLSVVEPDGPAGSR